MEKIELLMKRIDKFNKESSAEEPCEENTENQPFPLLAVVFPIHNHEQGKQRQIGKRLINLCGVAWSCENRVGTRHPAVQVFDKAEAPRQCGVVAVNLVVKQVADADERTHKGYRHHQAVESPYRALLRYIF